MSLFEVINNKVIILFFIVYYSDGFYTNDENCTLAYKYSNPLYINESNTNLFFQPTIANIYPNMNCSWQIFFHAITPEEVVRLSATFGDLDHEFYSLLVWNCEPIDPEPDSTTKYLINAEYGNKKAYSQEPKICISFKTLNKTDIKNMTSFWTLNLDLVNITFKQTTMLTSDDPLNIFQDWDNFTAVTLQAAHGVLEAYMVFQLLMEDLGVGDKGSYYVYDNRNLTNFLRAKEVKSANGFNKPDTDPIRSTTQTMTILIEFTDNSYLFYTNPIQCVYRIVQDGNCRQKKKNSLFNNTLGMAIGHLLNNTVDASLAEPCIYTVIVPYVQYSTDSSSLTLDSVPILNLSTVSYEGNSSVKVLLGYKNNDTNMLFDFTQKTASYWSGVTFYGFLISFIIPSNGTLQISYQLQHYASSLNYYFDDITTGIAVSPNYPLSAYTTDTPKIDVSSSCSLQLARFNVMIVYANILNTTRLQISNGITTITSYQNQTIRMEKVPEFEATRMYIEFVDLENDYDDLGPVWNGFFIKFEAVNVKPTDQKSSKTYIWIINICAGLFIIALALVITWLIYRMKRREKRLEKLYDILRDMHFSTEDIGKMRTQGDEFLIKEKNLHISFDHSIGQGSTSTVYKGQLVGASPLHVSQKLIETQRFVDCQVAVKIASQFGQDEAENLFQEINVMKRLGIHTNIISFLGWCMYKEAPCLAFELANRDLLIFVKTFREDEENLPKRIFLSILWQITKGMQYMSSKGLIHRDLAARNILLCENHTAKISDFGLCCTIDPNLSFYQSSLLKKLPIRWLPIEALENRVFTEKSDIWSFGILMYEVYSLGKVPYENLENDELLQFLQPGERLECPVQADEELYSIMLSCWEEKPENRPKFGKVLKNLREMLEKKTESYNYLC